MTYDKFFTTKEIRDLIQNNTLISKSDDSKIQPSSFEPTISDEAYIIPNVFRPSENKTVYETIMNLNCYQRIKINLQNGYELKRGFTYLIKLNERIIGKDWSVIKASPKSSLGRLFVNTRCLFDYNSCFDHITLSDKTKNKELSMWLLVQPLKFNIIISPNITMNQLRFSNGHGLSMRPNQILEEFTKSPLIKIYDDGLLKPAIPYFIHDAIRLNLDLEGTTSNEVIGFRAKDNPEPIDLREKYKYEVLDYFEPIIKRERKTILHPNECYLFMTTEFLSVPSHLAYELKFNSPHLLRGELHFAGFIDNGFNGYLVLEVISHENTPIELEHNMPIGELLVFYTGVPEKIYGSSIGSHYNEQTGPRIAKYFKDVDYSKMINHSKLCNRN